jgi:hypothetical protein
MQPVTQKEFGAVIEIVNEIVSQDCVPTIRASARLLLPGDGWRQGFNKRAATV